ncbi:MAG: hypothetical protein EBR82_19350 [Caulobacteraceae bacterium]|nr:hypothetical protein [Caulobacteraceae bacterium]
MSLQPSPKKSETLEIRLPHPTKTAFMARCQDRGQTASEAVRRFIDAEIAGSEPRRPRVSLWQALAAAAAGLAIGAVAAPSLAQTAHGQNDPRVAFDRLDRNHDGVVSYAEFSAR